MATMNLSQMTQAALAQALLGLLDAGDGTGRIEFYTAPMPASAADAITTQTLLGVTPFASPTCGSVVNLGAEFAVDIEDPEADASGTAAWARVFNGENGCTFDVDVSDASGDGIIRLDNVEIVAGGKIRIALFRVDFAGGAA